MPDRAGAAELREKAEALKSSASAALRQASQEAQRLEAEAARREHEEEGRRIATGHRAVIRELTQETKRIKASLRALAIELAQADESVEQHAARRTTLARRLKELEAERDRLLADASVPLESFAPVTQNLTQLIYLEPMLQPAIAQAERRAQTLRENQSELRSRLTSAEGQIDARQEEADDPFGEKRKRRRSQAEREAAEARRQAEMAEWNEKHTVVLPDGTRGRLLDPVL